MRDEHVPEGSGCARRPSPAIAAVLVIANTYRKRGANSVDTRTRAFARKIDVFEA
jgi:hypothetical protein